MTSYALPADGTRPAEGMRARKKRQTRELISNTATRMFLAHGFDQVKVTDIARQCDVSEKTVYNYFPTKESLLLDREGAMADAIRRALGPGSPARSPVEAALDVLAGDLDGITASLGDRDGDGLAMLRRFTELLDATPSLRAAQRDLENRLVQVAAEAMAARAGVDPDDPEPQIAAHSVIGLWRVQFHALRRYAADDAVAAGELHETVSAEVRRAARLIDSGLWTFGVMVTGSGGREQLDAAAETAQRTARQVATTLRQARTTWRQKQRGAGHSA
jgi:AcrR family transcriptional regulator